VVRSASDVTEGIEAHVDLGAYEAVSFVAEFSASPLPGPQLEPDQQATIEPGHYQAISVKPGAMLTLNAGSYYFESLEIEPQAELQIQDDAGPTVVYVRGRFSFKGEIG